MKLNERTLAMWSRIGTRATYGLVMAELAKQHENLMVLTADTSTSAGLDRYKKAFPDRYFDVGISEQNLIGVAAGLASEGLRVFASTFAPFITMRCCEQIRVNLGYMGFPVTLVGLASGVVLGTLGYTHCCIEDLAVMRAIPGMTVLSPADCGETAKVLSAAMSWDGPIYIRLCGDKDCPIVYPADYELTIGKAISLRQGGDIALLATGTMVFPALRAVELLQEQRISASVMDVHTIKPIDADAIRQAAKSHRLLVTVEEHSTLGGLGSAVAEVLAQARNTPPLLTLGLPVTFGKTGEYAHILEQSGLTAEGIARSVTLPDRNMTGGR
jgi:transketolase